jgi:hypothetical protein
MTENVSYKVSWTTGSRPAESRIFSDFEPAAEFYDGIVDDPRTSRASLVEIIEKEVRCHEHEQPRKTSS